MFVRSIDTFLFQGTILIIFHVSLGVFIVFFCVFYYMCDFKAYRLLCYVNCYQLLGAAVQLIRRQKEKNIYDNHIQ